MADFWAELKPRFDQDMPKYVAEGKVKPSEHMFGGGIAAAGDAFVGMMRGENLGKAVVAVAPELDPHRK